MNRSGKRGAGFTLIELLVVMGIIVLLAGLLVPVLSNAKFHARNTTCKNNLRQLSLALMIYTDAHGVYPTAQDNAESPPPWWTRLDGMDPGAFRDRGSGGGFWCPMNRGSLLVSQNYENGELLVNGPVGYAYNENGIGGGGLGLGGRIFDNPNRVRIPARESDVRVASEMIALGDSFNRSRNSGLDGLINLSGTIGPVTGATLQIKWKMPIKEQPSFVRHRGQANRMFVDGHLETEKMRRVFAASDEQLRRWNIDHLPHRDLLMD